MFGERERIGEFTPRWFRDVRHFKGDVGFGKKMIGLIFKCFDFEDILVKIPRDHWQGVSRWSEKPG